jgi:hypothetical protein
MGLCCCCQLHAQLKKFYAVKESTDYDTIHFSLKATSGTCHIKPSYHTDPVTIYGNPNFSDVNPAFHTEISNKTNQVALHLEDYKKSGLSQAIAYNVFGSKKNDDMNFWKVYFNQEKTYKLNLNYGVGNADVNLSGLPVSNFKLETGSADVTVGYDMLKPNHCSMDTFLVKVDLGTIHAKNVNLSNANHIIADVGFGNAVLDFNESNTKKCSVSASVGAGTLKIVLPKKATPTIIYFKKSPLCNISVKQGFEEVDKNVYVNAEYNPDAENLMTFILDVALGNISFEYKD